MTEDEIQELRTAYEEARQDADRWGHQLREANETLKRIAPLYKKFYRNPLFWLIRPIDAEFESKMLMQCLGVMGKGGCSKLYWLDDDTQTGMHEHHWHGRATETTVWQYIKARYMPWLIKHHKPGVDH